MLPEVLPPAATLSDSQQTLRSALRGVLPQVGGGGEGRVFFVGALLETGLEPLRGGVPPLGPRLGCSRRWYSLQQYILIHRRQ